VEIVVTSIVNPASFLSRTTGEPVSQDCLEMIEAVYSSQPDLKEEPLEDAEDCWYTDRRSFVRQGVRKTRYAVTTTDQVIKSKTLAPNTSAQKAEIIALTQALELAKGKKINIWTASKYAFGLVNAHGAVWKERRLLSTQGKHIKHVEEILKPLEAVQLPKKAAIMHCKVHQKGDTAQELGNAMADCEAKRAAEKSKLGVQSLVPDGKVQIVNPSNLKKIKKLVEDLGGEIEKGRWAKTPQGKTIIPFTLLWAVVMAEYRKSH